MCKTYNKLVRDKIPEIIASKGRRPQTSILSAEKFRQALRDKLIEEVTELSEAETSEEILQELADVAEVIAAIGYAHQITNADIERVRLKKAAERGGFDKQVFLETVDED